MSVCVYSMFVLFCVQVSSLRRLIPCPKGPTDCVKQQETEKLAKVQQRAVDYRQIVIRECNLQKTQFMRRIIKNRINPFVARIRH
jgi:hypothetical protein